MSMHTHTRGGGDRDTHRETEKQERQRLKEVNQEQFSLSPHVLHTGLKLMYPRMTFNPWSSCFSLLRTGIKGLRHYAGPVFFLLLFLIVYLSRAWLVFLPNPCSVVCSEQRLWRMASVYNTPNRNLGLLWQGVQHFVLLWASALHVSPLFFHMSSGHYQ